MWREKTISENEQERMESARPFLAFGFTPFVGQCLMERMLLRGSGGWCCSQPSSAAGTYTRELQTLTGQAQDLPNAIALLIVVY